MTRRFASSLLAIAPLACAAVALAQSRRAVQSSKPAPVSPLSSSDFAGYDKWKQITSRPHRMDPLASFFCRIATPDERAQFDRSVHSKKYARVFVNPIAKPAMLAGWKASTLFPPGSVIVKAKFGSDKRGAPIELLTVMKKREKGYFPAGLDWEYAVVKADGQTIVESGKIAACAKCHEEQKHDGGTFRWYYLSGN